MEELQFKLENFEGPLDLLLNLIRKNKMDLHDIPILDLIEQYLVVIRSVQEHRLDVASEFIEMAARLVEMKSYLLLPRSEEAERMKEELTGQLIEYDLCKKMAGQLATMYDDTYMVVRKPAPVTWALEYNLHHDPKLLVDAWDALSGKGKKVKKLEQDVFEPIVSTPIVSVVSRVVHVLRGLVTGKLHSLHQLFSKSDSRSTTVATFLAVLEMVRNGRICIDDDAELKISREKIKWDTSGESEWT